jgi:hypothetical protein
MKYYEMWSYLDEDCALIGGPELPDEFNNWLDPAPWDVPVPQDLTLHIEKPGELLAFYDDPVPILRQDIVKLIHSAGVENIEDYPITIVDPSSGMKYQNYRAVKVIGAVSAVDERKSEGNLLDENDQFGSFYDSIIIDEKKAGKFLAFRLVENLSYLVVADKVRDKILENEDIYGIEFKPLFEMEDDDDETDPDLAGENLESFDFDGDINHD